MSRPPDPAPDAPKRGNHVNDAGETIYVLEPVAHLLPGREPVVVYFHTDDRAHPAVEPIEPFLARGFRPSPTGISRDH